MMLSEKTTAEVAKHRKMQDKMGKGKLSGDIDQQIADLFGIAIAPFSTSVDACLTIKDRLCPDDMILFRDYPGHHYLVDLQGESGEAGGRGPTRARAFVAALCEFMIFKVEAAELD